MDGGSPSEVEEWKELAEKLMTHPHPEGPVSIQLFRHETPHEWGDVPVPSRARLVGGAIHSAAGDADNGGWHSSGLLRAYRG